MCVARPVVVVDWWCPLYYLVVGLQLCIAAAPWHAPALVATFAALVSGASTKEACLFVNFCCPGPASPLFSPFLYLPLVTFVCNS